ncbi:MAG TPA: ABC transporter permease [Candidatus Brocadiia bacterium]|nr:ABC transporter permease [Planctomycetota bacterium]MDO8093948.1 ABC transporter permease [Candidatus Brocadiales bacterium]
MKRHIEFLVLANKNLARNRTKTIVVVLCLVAILFPFITAIAISEGVWSHSLISVEKGGDLYLTLDEFGKNAPIPAQYFEKIKNIYGVTRAVPRIIGRGFLQNKLAVIVGINKEDTPDFFHSITGRLFSAGKEEVVIGKGLADYFKLNIGDKFSMQTQKRKTFTVVGIFSAKSGIWSSNLILMSLEVAGELFNAKGMFSDIQLFTLPGHNSEIARDILEILKDKPYRLQDKQIVRNYFNRGFALKGGIFTVLYLLAFALGIPAVLVASGFGLTERRREVGILKATGWQTTEILELISFEQLLISLIGAVLALLLSFLWMKVFNGAIISQFFIAEIGMLPKFTVPAKFLPLPTVIAFFLSFIITMVGCFYTTWRAATVPPVDSMR